MKPTLVLLLVLLNLGVHKAVSQSVLFDQTINSVGTAVASQHFESANSTYDCMAADDFTVPTGDQWHIDSIVARGHYVVPTGQPLPGSGIIVHIYTDENGSPDSLIYSDTNLMNVDLNLSGHLVARFTSALILDPGHYWVGISARKDAGTSSTQWEWFNSTSNNGDTAHWTNPANGFNLGCTSYDKISACLGNTYPAMSFSVHGCEVAPPSIFNLPSSATVCTNDPVTITVSSSVSFPIWSWSGGQSGDSIVLDQTGQYIVSCKDSLTDCVSRDTIDVFAIEPPIVQLNDDTVCAGEILSLGVEACAGCTYDWSTGSTSDSTFITTGGQVSVTVTEGIFGCNESATAQIDLITVDSVQFGVVSPAIICEGDSLILPLNSTYESYLWSNGSTESSIWVSQGGTYAVTVGIGECNDEGEIEAIVVSPPNVSIRYKEEGGASILYVDSGYASYSWSNGGSEESITVSDGGVFSVTVIDTNGCQGTASFDFIVGVDEFANEVSVFPNPVSDILTLSSESARFKQISIHSISGVLLMQEPVSSSEARIDLSSLTTGAYILRYELHSGQITRLIIAKE